MASGRDPWEQLGDIDGKEKYRVLQVSDRATPAEIKQAYRSLARKHHPDKGGDAVLFARIQGAYETLSSKNARGVYDDWAGQVQFRQAVYQQRAEGGEDILLEELASAGVLCNPFTQLVVLCEVCGRPSNKECWTCKMPICSFCTLKRHWKEGFALHWPLINSDHMKTQLAKREFEKKRVEDANLLDMEDPNWRSESQRVDMRAFKAAALDMQRREDRLVAYDYALARFYMWAQTEEHIHIAMHIPTGFQDKDMEVICDYQLLRVAAEGSPPLIERIFHSTVETTHSLNSFKTQDNRTMLLSLRKQAGCVAWPKLFRGDSDGVRCMQPPYSLAETERDVTIEIELPFLFESEDVIVDISNEGLTIEVQDFLSCSRHYWQPRDEKDRARFQAVNPASSMWCLDESTSNEGFRSKALLIVLVKPELTEDEVTWKKGRRQDNLNAKRADKANAKGYRFFQDDEDTFGLENILQAICWLETGQTFVPAKPWDRGSSSHTVADRNELSAEVQDLIKTLLQESSKDQSKMLKT